MNRVVRVAVAVLTCGVLLSGVAGAAVPAKSRKVSTDAYAKTMCKTFNKMLGGVNGFGTDITSLEITDNASFQADVAAAGDDVLAKLAKAEKKLKSVYPDIDDGKKVSKLFAKTPVELQTLLGDALSTFAAADPNSPAFQADVAVFNAALITLSTKLTDVTSQITDQDLIGSVADEKSCHEIFPVIGG